MRGFLKNLSPVVFSILLIACGNDAPPTTDSDSNSIPPIASAGIISGTINITSQAASILNSATLNAVSVHLSAVTVDPDKKGGFWVVPNPIAAAAAADDELIAQVEEGPKTSHSAKPPMIIPIPTVVDSNGRFFVDVPAGSDYSLLYIDPETSRGVNKGNIDVGPDEEVKLNISDSDLMPYGDLEFTVVQDDAGTPLSGVKVTLLNFSQNTLTSLDGTGKFEGSFEFSSAI